MQKEKTFRVRMIIDGWQLIAFLYCWSMIVILYVPIFSIFSYLYSFKIKKKGKKTKVISWVSEIIALCLTKKTKPIASQL